MPEGSGQPTRTITLAVTGASGSMFARAMLRALEADERVGCVNFISSDSGLRVMAEELGLERTQRAAAAVAGRRAAQNAAAE